MRRTICLTIAALTALALAGTANAGVLVASAPSCSDDPGTNVFSPWLDPASYVLAPGGAAESAKGWTLTGGAGVVDGNEPWNVRDAKDSHALALPAGATATTDTMCIGIENPDVRVFTRGSGVGTLRVDAIFELAHGAVVTTAIGSLPTSSWTPSTIMPLAASLLPLLPGDHTPVRFRFTAQGADFAVDDVYVDPFARH
jgi:hypothetical protein